MSNPWVQPDPTRPMWVGLGWVGLMWWVRLDWIFFDPPWSKNPFNPTQPDPYTPLVSWVCLRLGRRGWGREKFEEERLNLQWKERDWACNGNKRKKEKKWLNNIYHYERKNKNTFFLFFFFLWAIVHVAEKLKYIHLAQLMSSHFCCWCC